MILLRSLFLLLLLQVQAYFFPALAQSPADPESNRAARRQKLIQQIPPRAVAVLFSGSFSSHGETHEGQGAFKADPAFFFLTGLNLPNAALVLFPAPRTWKGKSVQGILFFPQPGYYPAIVAGSDRVNEFLENPIVKNQIAGASLVDWNAYCRDSLENPRFEKILTHVPALYPQPRMEMNPNEPWDVFTRTLSPGYPHLPVAQELYLKIRNAKPADYSGVAAHVSAFLGYYPALRSDPILYKASMLADSTSLVQLSRKIDHIKLNLEWLPQKLAEQRQIKEYIEMDALTKAAAAADAGIRRAFFETVPGLSEGRIIGRMDYAIREGMATPFSRSRVATGKNTQWPEYQGEQGKAGVNDLIIADATVSSDNYLVRITRTFHLGTLTAEQQKLFDLVASTHGKLLENCRSGAKLNAVGDNGRLLLENGYKSLGLTKETFETAQVLPVGLGLPDPMATEIKEGMTLLVETTLHIPESANVHPSLKGVGIEIRDVVKIAPGGRAIPLTFQLPFDRNGISELRSGHPGN